MGVSGAVRVGFLYPLPGIDVLYYTVIDNVFEKNFVEAETIQRILESIYFQMALKNTVQMLLLCLACTILLTGVRLFLKKGRGCGSEIS